jgi:HEPN domain-containing protein
MNIDAQEKYGHWLEYAQYDLDTADAMYSSGRWLYVAFSCQQAIEKLCKGLYTLHIDDDAPHVHSIVRIVSYFADKLPEVVSEEKYHLFETLVGFYIKGRYPSFKQRVSAMLNEQEANKLLTQTKEVFAWLQTMKPSTPPSNNMSQK